MGLQIRRQDDGWSIDWPEIESYEIGPSSIAWIMWHIIYWWRTTLDYNFGDGTLKKEDITWPGSVEKAKEEINNFYKMVSNNVKKYRLEKVLSQEKLALDIGIKSIAFYSNCENNKYDKHFNLEHLYKISKSLNVPLEDLIK